MLAISEGHTMAAPRSTKARRKRDGRRSASRPSRRKRGEHEDGRRVIVVGKRFGATISAEGYGTNHDDTRQTRPTLERHAPRTTRRARLISGTYRSPLFVDIMTSERKEMARR